MLLYVFLSLIDLLSVTFVYSSSDSFWLEWQCSRNCSDSRQHRTRFCKVITNCRQKNETRPSNCYVGKKCPSKCVVFSWGPDCLQKCHACVSDCDKFTGECAQCKKGHKNPKNSCHGVCGPYEYGNDYALNCRDKCKGEDCYERINGICIVNGGISEWGPWKCNRECSSREHVRFRYCNNPAPAYGGQYCTEDGWEHNNVSCNTDIRCPEDCLDFEWGFNCSQRCFNNCILPCDKSEGTCLCKPGFKGVACDKECDIFEYGANCSGDCRTKCSGQDCINRITGECKTHYGIYIPIVIAILLIPICLFYCLGPKDVDLDFGSEEEDNMPGFKKRTSYPESHLTSITQGMTMSDVDDETAIEIYKPGTRESSP